jgi:hypothetical protein
MACSRRRFKSTRARLLLGTGSRFSLSPSVSCADAGDNARMTRAAFFAKLFYRGIPTGILIVVVALIQFLAISVFV